MRRWLQLAGKHSTRRKHFCSSGCSSGGFETLHEIQSHWVQNHKTPAIKSKCHEIKLKTFSRDFVLSSMGSARLLREIRTDGVRTNNFLAETDTIFWRRIYSCHNQLSSIFSYFRDANCKSLGCCNRRTFACLKLNRRSRLHLTLWLLFYQAREGNV